MVPLVNVFGAFFTDHEAENYDNRPIPMAGIKLKMTWMIPARHVIR